MSIGTSACLFYGIGFGMEEYWFIRKIMNSNYQERVGDCGVAASTSTGGASEVSAYVYAVGSRYDSDHCNLEPNIPDNLIANPEWKEKIRQFCEATGFPYREPKWWLISGWY